jgi:hypothetical protein
MKKAKIALEFLDHLKNIANKLVPTVDDGEQFMRNVFKGELLRAYTANFHIINDYVNLVGKEIYKRKNSFAYSEFEERNSLNQTDNAPVLFTEELFNELLVNIVQYWIDYRIKELVENSISRNSTSSISNIMFTKRLEAKQEMIREYRCLLELLKKD